MTQNGTTKILVKDLAKIPKYFPTHGNHQVDVDLSQSNGNLTEITAKLLSEAKNLAEDYLGETVTYAVVTAPAQLYHSQLYDSQREVIIDAGTIAHLDVLRVLSQPNVALIAHGLDREVDEAMWIVCDIGASAFDVTLVSIDYSVFEPLAVIRDIRLGGESFNRHLLDYLVSLYNKDHADIRDNPESMETLEREVENAKLALSSQMESVIKIEAEGHVQFSHTLTRAKVGESPKLMIRR